MISMIKQSAAAWFLSCQHHRSAADLPVFFYLPMQPVKPEGWESRFLGDAGSLRSQMYKLATKAWMSGVTPGSVIRALGPWGPGLVEKYVTGRFSMHGKSCRA